MCSPVSGLGLFNKATGDKIRPLAFLSPGAAMLTGGLTKNKPATQPSGG